MFTIRRAADRGTTKLPWLDSCHTFSFGDYVDPTHHHYRTLRVINDDRIAPGGGFGTHGHRDMEILTRILSGTLEHRDSMGNGEVLRPGEWQAMTAGTGILHSEFNPSAVDPVHLLQIWLIPDRKGLSPTYRQRSFATSEATGRWQLIAAPDGAEGTLTIHQDARLYQTMLSAGSVVRHKLAPGRGAFLHVATGSAVVNGQYLFAGDAVAVEGEPAIEVMGESGEAILFDLA